MNKQEFLKYGHEFVDWAAEYMENAEKYPVTARISPGDIRKKLPSAPPEAAEPMETIFRDFQEIIMPGMTHWQHPGWFAYFPANNSPASVLAELLTAGLGAQCMSLEHVPGGRRARGGRPRLAPRNARPARGLGRGHPGHGLDLHPGGPPDRPGEGHRITKATRRA